MTKVLKARYYNFVNFLETSLGHNPSFLWRSLLSARYLIEKGIRWRVGNGQDIDAVSGRWIPQPISFSLLQHSCSLPTSPKVANLIDWDLGQWNLNLLKGQVDDDDDLRLILHILISRFPRRDELVWHFNDHGGYTVKSGYNMGLQWRSSSSSTSSSMGTQSKVWKLMWAIHIPPKVKHFLLARLQGTNSGSR